MTTEKPEPDWKSPLRGEMTLYDFGANDVAAFTVYEISAFFALVVSFVSVNLLIFKDHSYAGHGTAKLLAISFKIAQLIQSCFVITLTGMLLIQRYSIFGPWSGNLLGIINIAAIEQTFISMLIVIDIGIRAAKGAKYGSNLTSIMGIFSALIVTVVISYLLWYLMTVALARIMVYFFISIIALMQLSNAVLTIYLLKAVKEMRRKSVLISSLTERHECFKNLELLRNFLPISFIVLVCGILSLIGTLGYVISPTPFSPFVCVFGWYELSSILTSFYYMSARLKEKLLNKQNTVHIISKHTFQTLDNHFDGLKQLWRK